MKLNFNISKVAYSAVSSLYPEGCAYPHRGKGKRRLNFRITGAVTKPKKKQDGVLRVVSDISK